MAKPPTTTAADGRPGGTVPAPDQPEVRSRAALLGKEYVAAGVATGYENYLRALGPHVDDITRDLNPNIYQQILKDPVVAADFRAVKLAVLADPPTLRPAVDDADDPLYEDAKQEVAFAEWTLDNLRTPLEDVCDDLLDSMALGHRVAEQVHAQAEAGKWAGRLTLDRLKPKPRGATAFVVDAFSNVVGLLARIPGLNDTPYAGTLPDDPREMDNFLPRNKFLVMSWAPRDNDPRGTSVLRPCYTPWWEKQQTLGAWLKWLALCATPLLVGIAGKDADTLPPTDPDGNLLPADPGAAANHVQALLNTLVRAQGGSALALPFGTDVKWITSQGGGQQFLSKIEYCDRAMTRAVTLQTLATAEAQHDTRAAAEVHQDVMGLGIRRAKGVLGRVITWDLLYWLVAYNRGRAQADLLCPRCTFSPTEQHDRGADLSAWASVGYQIAPSQMAAVDEEVGLPVRTPEEAQPPLAQGQQGPDAGGQAPPGGPGAAPGAGDTRGGTPPTPAAPPDLPPDVTARADAAFAAAPGDFDESKHPRGQPTNRGQFGPGGGAQAAKGGRGKAAAVAPAAPQPAPAAQQQPAADPGDRPRPPGPWQSDEHIAEHGKAMAAAHEADPRIQRGRAKEAELAKRYEELSFRARTLPAAQSTEAFEQAVAAKVELDNLRDALSHESRRSLALSFYLEPERRAKVNAFVRARANGPQHKNWQEAHDKFLYALLGEGLGRPYVSINSTRGRAYADGVKIFTAKDDDPGVSAHEFGHTLEADQWVKDRVAAFREKRFDPKDDVPMSKEFPNYGYARDEVGNRDDMEKAFGDANSAAYSGKTYPGGLTELVSMGLEYLYRDPVRMARDDPEYFGLVMGILQRGEGKK